MVNLFQDKTKQLSIIVFFLFSATVLIGQTSCDKEINNIYKYVVRDYPSNMKKSKPFKEFKPGDNPFDTSVTYSNTQIILTSQLDTSTIKSISSKLSDNNFYKRILKDNKENVDSICISKTERIFIDNCLKNLSKFVWTESSKNQYGLTNFKLHKTINNNEQKTNLDLIVYDIMQPIIIRNCSIAFVYSYYDCGGLCGSGSLIILHKDKNGNWEEWKTLYTLSS